MYSKILVPLPHDLGLSRQTLDIGKALATSDGAVVAINAHEALDGSVASCVDQANTDEGLAQARQTLSDETTHVDSVRTEIVKGHTYSSTIDDAANYSLIGTNRTELSDRLLGPTAARVVRHVPSAAHVCRST